ncbi:MAG: hypothetical protein JWP28_3129 [Phenylobacterium sp.]|uniref:hypothetical protein n=1 Tax=Phenylobacterium sp. TaxID=1871053 RepID=UPI00262D1FAD|nr:hypothetical protein [Phenylobacterium sp.]MDB5499098.1 hypothetical protein [Phenylobacterium sp.]
MNDTETTVRLQPSLRLEAERLAAADGVNLDRFVNVALAEKLSALETESYLSARAAKGRREGFLAFLDEAGDEPPAEGD